MACFSGKRNIIMYLYGMFLCMVTYGKNAPDPVGVLGAKRYNIVQRSAIFLLIKSTSYAN